MSYKYGINGNDLNWDEMMFLNSFIEELELDIFNGKIKLDEDGYAPEGVYEGYSDSNPTMIYYDGEEINIQAMLKDGKKIDDYINWYIIHDTNDNFVSLIGDVPDKYLVDEYIAERNEYEGC